MRLLCLFILTAILGFATPAKIFCVLPVKVKSHSILFDRLIKELASRGHEITYVTPFKSKEASPNITEIIIPDLQDIMGSYSDPIRFRHFPQVFIGALVTIIAPVLSNVILDMPEVKKAIETQHFDLVFGESYMDESVLAGVAWKNQAPLISLCTFPPNTFANYAVGNPAPPSYVTDTFLAFRTEMTYFERVLNFMTTMTFDFLQRVTMFLQDRVMRKHFGDDLPSLDSIWRNHSLLLVNHHAALSFPRPQLPNTVDVAGMHIYPPKPLPKEFEDFMYQSKNGVVLFSLGTNVKSSSLPPETIQGIIKAFARLKENVLWKFETTLDNLPENVKISPWIPQSDILAHPNLKLFVTHGGLLSTTEAVFRGKPIVGIPVMADQPVNMKNTENVGLGITLNLNELSEDTLHSAITEVISNPKYAETAKQKSKILNDSPMSPLDTAVWWVEYVIRNNGASHLRSAAQDLWWFQLHSLDVIPVVILFATGTITFYLWLLKTLFRKCFMSKTHKKTNDSKKNQ